jgi:uncharacterized membrane protein
VQDFDFLGTNKGDVIDEFPFFSFLLGDLHPHVLAMPFAFLAMALALNLLLGGGGDKIRWFGIPLRLSWPTFGLAALSLGAMGFLNTWDFPFYVALFAGAYVLKRIWDMQTTDPMGELSLWEAAKDLLSIGFALGVTGGLLYLPFYVGFSSQAGGIIPNLIYITKGIYEWIMFAPLLIPIFGLLFFLWQGESDRKQLMTGLKVTLSLTGLLLLVTFLLTALISILHRFSTINPDAGIAANAFLGSLAAPGFKEAIIEGFRRRLMIPGTWLTLGVMLVFTISLLWPRRASQSSRSSAPALPRAHTFALLLILIGALLVYVPEFFFLRDFFGYRINTIFKFYFLAWLLWSVAAAYATIVLWEKLKGVWGVVFKSLTVLVLLLSMLYPIMGLWSRTNKLESLLLAASIICVAGLVLVFLHRLIIFWKISRKKFTVLLVAIVTLASWVFVMGSNSSIIEIIEEIIAEMELDGTTYLTRYNPDDAAAIQWLQEAPLGVVAESVGGSYSTHARMATHSGQPNVLGWVGHEHQWRGSYDLFAPREGDIARLYCVANWPEAQTIIDQYSIRYIVVGDLERTTYTAGSSNCPSGLSEGKFERYLEPVFQQGAVTIYQVP